MTRWMVKLIGHEFDLRAMSKLFTEPACCVAKDPDGAYYLTRSSFATLEGFEVDKASQEWLTRANDLMRLRNLEYISVSLEGVYEDKEDGTRPQHIFLSGIAAGESRAFGELTVGNPDGQPRPDPEPARAEAQLRIAEQDAKVQEALTCWQRCALRDTDFCSYAYKVFEIIREEMAGGYNKGRGTDEIKQRGWATQAELLNFKAWANNRAISGTKARHAGNQAIDPRVVALSDGAALAIVQRLLNKWLDWKIEQTA